MNNRLNKSGYDTTTLVVLLLIVGIGGVLRFMDLGMQAMGADVMEFYKVSQQGVAPMELARNSGQYIGRLPPLWFAAHNAFLQTFDLPVNFSTARMPDVFMGILTVLTAFLLGCEVKDKRVGLLAAFFVAIQPLHIQMSRECYFYAPILPGCFLGLWAVLRMYREIHSGGNPGWLSYAAYIVALFLVTHIQISAWPYAVVLVGALFVCFIHGAIKKKISWLPTIILVVVCGVIGIPTLLGEWGMADVIHLVVGEGKDHWSDVFAAEKEGPLTAAWMIVSSFLFGKGLVRNLLNSLVLIAGVVAIVRNWRDSVGIRTFTWFSIGALALLTIIHTISVFPPTPRHYSSIFPFLVIAFALSVVMVGDWIAAAVKKPQIAFMLPVGGGMLLAMAFNAWPAYLATQLVGQPPYSEVTKWVDSNLPEGTLILCDRWFTPWNEFRINPATNVTFVYTIPNEPVQAYVQNKWRDTAIRFLQTNPGAAFYEGKEYWDQLGPWEWPHHFFANREVFYDKAGMTLDALGLHYRPFRTGYRRDWIPVTIYYNTVDDLLKKAAAENKKALVLYGKGWNYSKTQDGRDWRVFMDSADIDVYNLTDEPRTETLVLTGTSVQQQGVPGTGVKSIVTPDGVSCTFQPNRIQQVTLGPITLEPGRNVITCSSAGAAGQQVPLLISHIGVQN